MIEGKTWGEKAAAYNAKFSPEEHERIRRAMLLTGTEEAAFELHEQGLGYGRIGKALGIPKSSAQGAVNRARRKLRR